MPQYCLVKHHIVNSVIDGPDVGNEPDILPVSGDVTFYPILDRGDSVVVTAGAEKVSHILDPISARIVRGKIFVNGKEGVKLFAGGPDTNPERIRYRARFTGLNVYGGKQIDLKDVLFEAIPGGELSLAMSQPVPGAPYPGYSVTIEEGLSQIESARDDALDQVAGAVAAEAAAIRYYRRHLTSEDDLDALESGLYFVPTSEVSQALGIPGGFHGDVRISRWGGGETGAGIVIFTSREAPARQWSGTWSPTGTWQGWEQMHSPYVSPTHLTPADTMDSLQSGHAYVVPTAATAEALGLPVTQHGVLSVVRWGVGSTGPGLATFETREAPSRYFSGTWSPTGTWQGWHDTDRYFHRGNLTTADSMDALTTGAYNVNTGAVATALGLPAVAHGTLTVGRWGSGGLGAGVVEFQTRERPSRRFINTWSGSGTLEGWQDDSVVTTPSKTGQINWLTLFSAGHGWTTTGTNPTTPVADTEITVSTQSLRMSPAAGQSDTLQSPELNLDMRGKALVVWARYDSGEVNDGRTTGLQVRAYGSGSGNFMWRVIRPSGVTGHAKHGEWMQTWLVPEISLSGGGDWSNVKRIEIGTPDARIPDAREWHLQGVGVVDLEQRFQKGVVSITFDDGELENLRAARQHLTPRGWSATAYVMREHAQDPDRPWYMGEEQILELHEEHGWAIGSHQLERYLEMSDEDVDASFTADREWMTSIGLPEPRHLAWTQGAYDLAKIRVARRHFDTARSIFPGVDTLPTGDKFRIRALTSISDSGHTLAVPLSDVKIWIDRAVRNGGWLSLVFHTLTDNPQTQHESSWEFFEQVLDYVEASGAEVLTYDQITPFL